MSLPTTTNMDASTFEGLSMGIILLGLWYAFKIDQHNTTKHETED